MKVMLHQLRAPLATTVSSSLPSSAGIFISHPRVAGAANPQFKLNVCPPPRQRQRGVRIYHHLPFLSCLPLISLSPFSLQCHLQAVCEHQGAVTYSLLRCCCLLLIFLMLFKLPRAAQLSCWWDFCACTKLLPSLIPVLCGFKTTQDAPSRSHKPGCRQFQRLHLSTTLCYLLPLFVHFATTRTMTLALNCLIYSIFREHTCLCTLHPSSKEKQ